LFRSPLIYAMQKGSKAESDMIRTAIEAGGIERLADIQAVIESTGALKYTSARAQEAADLAIAALSDIPASDWKEALIAIADFSVRRRT
ncbi:MAG: octaprenyl diphosphate synthase, partial [Woeseia sp.]